MQPALDVEAGRDARLQELAPRGREAAALRRDADDRDVSARSGARRRPCRRSGSRRAPRPPLRVEDGDDGVGPVADDPAHRLAVVRVVREALAEDQEAPLSHVGTRGARRRASTPRQRSVSSSFAGRAPVDGLDVAPLRARTLPPLALGAPGAVRAAASPRAASSASARPAASPSPTERREHRAARRARRSASRRGKRSCIDHRMRGLAGALREDDVVPQEELGARAAASPPVVAGRVIRREPEDRRPTSR